MSDAIFSAEYAASLVQRARDTSVFHEAHDMDLVPFFECERKMHEDHDGYGSDERHWVEWYRETRAAGALCCDVIEQKLWAIGVDVDLSELSDAEAYALSAPWRDARYALGCLIYDFMHLGIQRLGKLYIIGDEE